MKLVLFLTITAYALVQVHCACDSAEGLLTDVVSGGTTISLDATGTTASGPASFAIYNQLIQVQATLSTNTGLSTTTRFFGTNGQKKDGTRSIAHLASNAYSVLKFTPAVSSVVLKMNYSPDDFVETDYPTISVLDSSDNVLTCYNLHTLAPISTPNGTNEYEWRGVTSANKISQLMFTGGTLAYWDVTFATAPPPPSVVEGDEPVAGPGGSSSAPILSYGLVSTMVCTFIAYLL